MLWFIAFAAFAGSSSLWGLTGEAWDPSGRLPDFSWAGYHAGEDAIPEVLVVANVRDFGAVGDGATDDTAAFHAALDATSGGALLVPEGTYLLTDVLEVVHGDLVIRGDGPDRTVLYFDRSLADIRGERPQWSWEGGLLWVQPTEVGAEVAEVTAYAARGGQAVEVDDASALSAGDWMVLRLTDDEPGTLGMHMHNDQAGGGTCSWQDPIVFRWPIRIAAVEGNTLTLAQPLRLDVRPEWSPALWSMPAVEEVGVESLRIRFPDVPYAGHLEEPGYNAIYFAQGVRDAWVREVAIENADNGILTASLTKRVTVSDLSLEGRTGHHGLNVAHTADGLFEDLHFGTSWVHEISVDHHSNGNVFKRVSADDVLVALDHHRDGSFENLFTDFSAETSWVHGGSWCAGPPSGARETFWNLPGPLPPPYFGYIQANVVGDLTVEDLLTEDAEWYENVSNLEPADLHQAQLDRRLGVTPDEPDDDDDDPQGCGCNALGGGVTWPLWVPFGWLCWRRVRYQPPVIAFAAIELRRA
jgi:hypothetical protein